MAGEVWNFWLCVGFRKLFWLCVGFGKFIWLWKVVLAMLWVLKNYFGYIVGFVYGKLFWLCCNSVVNFFRFRCTNTLELVLKFGRSLLGFFLDFFVGCLNIVCLHLPGVLCKFGTW